MTPTLDRAALACNQDLHVLISQTVLDALHRYMDEQDMHSESYAAHRLLAEALHVPVVAPEERWPKRGRTAPYTRPAILAHTTRRGHLRPDERDALCAKHAEGVSMYRLAREYGVSVSTVRHHIQKQAVSRQARSTSPDGHSTR